MSHALYARMRLEAVPCPLCDSWDHELLARTDRYGMGVRTVGCRSCGFVFTNPQPTQAALDDFYASHYRRYYRKIDVPTVEHVHEYGLAERARYTVDYLQAQEVLFDGVRVLDVGCGEGSILREIGSRMASAAAVGVEPGRGFADFARTYSGATILDSLSDLRRDGADSFDLIIVNHVLEHVACPVTFLRDLVPLTRSEGSVYVDVPDGTRYRSLTDLHIAHLCHFSPGTLQAAAARAGLQTAHIERHDPPLHPFSLRALLRARAHAPVSVSAADDVARRVRAIQATAWRYRLRHSAPVRAVAAATRSLRHRT